MNQFADRMKALAPDRRAQLEARMRERVESLLNPTSLVVKMNAAGSRVPLVCIHPTGGYVFRYADLAACLGSDQPLHAIRSSGLKEHESLFTSIPTMAAHYIRAVRRYLPHGPYRLSGWSMGAMVAFEMAQQLVAQNEPVQLLALFDMWAGPIRRGAEVNDRRILLSLLGLNERDGGGVLHQPDLDAQLQEGLRLAQQRGHLSSDMQLEEARRIFAVAKANSIALENYQPENYNGHITIFRCEQALDPQAGASPAEREPALGWERYALKGVSVHAVPGDHNNLLYRPYVEELCARLQPCLAQCGAY